MAAKPAEGWYEDPTGRHQERWYSSGWPTDLVRDREAELHDPLGVDDADALLRRPKGLPEAAVTPNDGYAGQPWWQAGGPQPGETGWDWGPAMQAWRYVFRPAPAGLGVAVLALFLVLLAGPVAGAVAAGVMVATWWAGRRIAASMGSQPAQAARGMAPGRDSTRPVVAILTFVVAVVTGALVAIVVAAS